MVEALDPRRAEPCNETREVSTLRARTVRPERFAVVRVAAVVAVRATTLRDGAVVVVRVVVRVARPREVVARDGAVVAVVPRYTVVVAVVVRGLARPERVALPARWARGEIVSAFTGAIGSANAARIDINVEHVKNAPPNKKTVPMAFLQQLENLRLVIFTLPRAWDMPRNPYFLCIYVRHKACILCIIITLLQRSVNTKTRTYTAIICCYNITWHNAP